MNYESKRPRAWPLDTGESHNIHTLIKTRNGARTKKVKEPLQFFAPLSADGGPDGLGPEVGLERVEVELDLVELELVEL